MEDIAALERITQALEQAAKRGDLEEAAALIARRATLIQSLASSPAVMARLQQIRASGDQACVFLRCQRARDAESLDRVRQVAATLPEPSSSRTVLALG